MVFFKLVAISSMVLPGRETVEVLFLCKHQREHPSRGRCWTLRTGVDWCESAISKTRLVGLLGSPADQLLLRHCLCCCSSRTRALENRNWHQVGDMCAHYLVLHFRLITCWDLKKYIQRWNSWQISLQVTGLKHLDLRDFPGHLVVKNLPAHARDTDLMPGLGGSHLLRGPEHVSHNYWAHELQLLKPEYPEPVFCNKRSHCKVKPEHPN